MMRNLMLPVVILLGFLTFQSPEAKAGLEGMPNQLTQEEISEGWILLFDGESLYGWDVWSGTDSVKVDNGAISTRDSVSTIVTKTTFGDYVLRFQYRISMGNRIQMIPRLAGEGDAKSQIGLPLIASETSWQDAEIRAEGLKYSLLLNGKKAELGPVLEGKESKSASGAIYLDAVNAKGLVELRSIKLLPLNTKPIFNGKNFDGWSILPDHKSEFSVTPAGELNIRNGNGQIETTGKWANFVLQMDIISNGDHLNSGVFFRGDPGAFWSGYESQIRNEWEGEDRTKPKDFGTGGIYFHKPARKVVSTDREWFTKTIVAHGNHMAVWVNGYQTSEFTDMREKGQNAREKCRLEAGVISLQGHDPTTDLSFRNIRIAPMD